MNRSEFESRGREVRTASAELRAASDEMALVGYATLFNNMSSNLGGFRETIKPGAFSRSIDGGARVVCLFNHDANKILGRVPGTLTVSEDSRGLKFKCILDPNNSEHKNLHSSVARGDVDQCSFSFTVPKGGQSFDDGLDPDTGKPCLMRTLTDVDLMDVSPVVYPAYPNTSVNARAEGRKKPDYSTNAADEAFRIITLRKAARSIANVRKTSPYPAPYDYREVCEQYDDAMVHAESALARCEDVDDTFDAWDETDERCKHSSHKDLCEAHQNARASLESAAMAMGAARMALARCMGK
jgi:Escherichia/Staphylococcus phage prohead protease